jgi:4'-phosphopantetheinyl transferase
MLKLQYSIVNSIDNCSVAMYLNRLPSVMHGDIIKYKDELKMKSRLLSRLMLQQATLEDGYPDALHYIKRDKWNKPFIEQWQEFNISYANELVVMTYGGVTHGVDAEKIQDIDFLSIVDSFHPEERAYILNSPKPLDCFFRTWVKKEAVLKAVGIGIVNGIDQFSCLTNPVLFQGLNWYLKAINIKKGFIIYTCTSQPLLDVKISQFSLQA